MSERYSYDRTAMGPASRLKDATTNLSAAEREMERAKSILQGLVKEMELVAKHTSDRTIRTNFQHIEDFAKRLNNIDSGMDKLLADIAHFGKTFK